MARAAWVKEGTGGDEVPKVTTGALNHILIQVIQQVGSNTLASVLRRDGRGAWAAKGPVVGFLQ